jgi:hypothetical protein
MSAFDSSSTPPSRSRRRVAAWLAFGVAGLAAGAVWATGFATDGGATGTAGASPIIKPSAPSTAAAGLLGTVTKDQTVDYNWAGAWGSIAATNMFKVDLTGKTGTYNLALLLTNGAALTNGGTGSGWASIQLQVEEGDSTAGDCSDVAFDQTDSTLNPKLMSFDTEDSAVYWNGLAGNKVYCVGVGASDGHGYTDGTETTQGTLLRATDPATPPSVYPEFVTTVTRAT